MKLKEIFNVKKPIIGMIHLGRSAAPIYENFPGLNNLTKKAIKDMIALEKGGIDGYIVEELNKPYKLKSKPEEIATMIHVANKIKEKASKPLGIHMHYDPFSSIAIAKKVGAKFIRTNLFVDEVIAEDLGPVSINPKQIMSYRSKNADDVAIFTDIQVKHTKMVDKSKPIEISAKQALENSSDAIIVTGSVTGTQPALERVKRTRKAIENFPFIIGSGLTKENAEDLLSYADGAIIGVHTKFGNIMENLVDHKKVREIMKAVEQLR